tara:strand:- start:194 stop:355 length:162 start_codon:yes stop_codon:yes gene_type:complete
MLVVINTSLEGIGIGGKGGKLSVGCGGGCSVFSLAGLVPSGSLRSLGGTTRGV